MRFQKWLNAHMGGKDVHSSSLEDQTKFLNWDLSLAGGESGAGALIRAAGNWRQAQDLFVRGYERPAD
jgi:hypothetical protein